jgi:ATP-binding cassette subfamily F protein 3
VLDEPTNHLDIAMREWLEGRLRDYRGAVLVVSHDRTLLDAVAAETWHLERGNLNVYRGGYSRARERRLEERRVRGKHARLGSAEVGRLEAAASRVAAWGKNNDRLARRARAIARRAERAKEGLVEAPVRERQIAMALQAGDARARTLVRASGLSKRYEGRVVLEGAALRVRAGDRVALLAPNGAGKTTLLRLLLGEVGSDDPEGEVRFADGVQPAYFDQTYHGLAPERPILAQLALRVGEGAAKALLGRYGFRPEDWPKRPRELSGGERARAGLALVAATRADLLVLDEPTNHLDVEALESLEEALLAYPGSLLFVTHDRAFAGRVAGRVLTIEGGRLLELEGGFEGYLRTRRGEARTLDPGRLLEGELAPPAPLPDPRREMERLEERLSEIEADLLRVGLSEREAERARLERDRGRERLGELYADLWAAPLQYAHRLRVRGLEVRADGDGGGWRFWARGAEGCPWLEGEAEGEAFRLAWSGEGEALPWFRAALLEGAAGIALERLGAHLALLPDGDDRAYERPGRPSPIDPRPDGSRVLTGASYAAWLGLFRPQAHRRPRLVFHPDYAHWARARRLRTAARRTSSEP